MVTATHLFLRCVGDCAHIRTNEPFVLNFGPFRHPFSSSFDSYAFVIHIFYLIVTTSKYSRLIRALSVSSLQRLILPVCLSFLAHILLCHCDRLWILWALLSFKKQRGTSLQGRAEVVLGTNGPMTARRCGFMIWARTWTPWRKQKQKPNSSHVVKRTRPIPAVLTPTLCPLGSRASTALCTRLFWTWLRYALAT